MRIITSWDDGRVQDMRLAKLLLKYKIPAIFFISGDTELNINEIRELAKSFRIGGHTKTHPKDMKQLDAEELKYVIQRNKEDLERIIQRDITDFAYPKGRYDERVIKAVEDAGFKTARTTVVGYTVAKMGPYRLPTTAHVHPSRVEYKGENWASYAWNRMAKGGDFMHIWGHSWEIDKFGMWDELETFLGFVREKVDMRELSI